MSKKKWIIIAVLAVCIGTGLLVLTLFEPRGAIGHLKVSVVDAYSNRPIANAEIVLPEAGISSISDENGSASLYGVPLSQPSRLERIIPCDYGETTILAYAEGYLPFALFHVHVYEGRMRNGPVLYLFPLGTEDGMDAISMIESPAEEWVKRLLDHYAP